MRSRIEAICRKRAQINVRTAFTDHIRDQAPSLWARRQTDVLRAKREVNAFREAAFPDQGQRISCRGAVAHPRFFFSPFYRWVNATESAPKQIEWRGRRRRIQSAKLNKTCRTNTVLHRSKPEFRIANHVRIGRANRRIFEHDMITPLGFQRDSMAERLAKLLRPGTRGQHSAIKSVRLACCCQFR